MLCTRGCCSCINRKSVFICFTTLLIYTVPIVPAPLFGMLKSLGSGSVYPFESLALVLFNARTGHIEPSGRELSLCITLLTCHFIPKGSPTVILQHRCLAHSRHPCCSLPLNLLQELADDICLPFHVPFSFLQSQLGCKGTTLILNFDTLKIQKEKAAASISTNACNCLLSIRQFCLQFSQISRSIAC